MMREKRRNDNRCASFLKKCKIKPVQTPNESQLGSIPFEFAQFGHDPCFQSQLEEAAGDGHVGIGAVVVYRDHISTAAGNDFRDFLQLTRFVCQGNGETDVSSRWLEAPG